MIVDRTHRPWILASAVILAVATVLYLPYHFWGAFDAINGPKGGHWLGLLFGFVGYGFMLFAGALGLRARRPTWRLGRAETWLKGHVWLALIAYPIILYHAGFAMGGALTLVLMVLFTVVTASGVLGVVLQNLLPRAMMDRVPLETIYEQIDHVLDQIRDEADALVLQACDPERAAAEAAAAVAGPGRRAAPSIRRAQMGRAVAATAPPPPEAQTLKEFYAREVRPYLGARGGAAPDPGDPFADVVGGAPPAEGSRRGNPLDSPSMAAVIFAQLRTRMPLQLHAVVDDLEAICEERRQLRVQTRLHHWLHAWLLVHVPLSAGLLLLSAVHAVMALRY